VTSGTLGVALFDPNNRYQDDDTLTDYAGLQRLGVFLHTINHDGMVAYPSSVVRTTFDPFTPARLGTPIGGDELDGPRLRLELLDARATAMFHAVTRLARRPRIALVGHEPDLGHLASRLIGLKRPLEFRKGAVCRIDVDGLPPGGPGQLRWFAPPRMLRRLA